MERRIAALPPPLASMQRRCWPHRGPHTGVPAFLAIPLLTISNPVFSAVVVIESRNYNCLLLWIGESQKKSHQSHALFAASFARC